MNAAALALTGELQKRLMKKMGVYENGIIMAQYIPWDGIHSYSCVDEQKISLLLMSGVRVELPTKNGFDEIARILAEKGGKGAD